MDNDEQISRQPVVQLTYKNNSTDSSLLRSWFLAGPY